MPIIVYKTTYNHEKNKLDLTWRHKQLHDMMTGQNKQRYLYRLQDRRQRQIKQFLNIFNSKSDLIVDFEKYLVGSIHGNINNINLKKALETSVAETQNLAKNLNSGVSNLQGLVEPYCYGASLLHSLIKHKDPNNKVVIHGDEFNNKIQKTSLNKVLNKYKKDTTQEIGNIIGDFGEMGAAAHVMETLDHLIKHNLSNNTNGIKLFMVNTGNKKINNRTVRSDNVIIAIDQNSQKFSILPLDAKLNTAFANLTQNNSTGRPIKIAQRTVASFIKDIDHKKAAKSFEFALYNYISYHQNYSQKNNHVYREDWIEQNPNEWKQLRRAVGMEMLYMLTNGKNNGEFNYNLRDQNQNLNFNATIRDLVTLHFYGNKLFVDENIVNSALYYKDGKKLRSTYNQATATMGGRGLMPSINIESARSKILGNTAHIQGELRQKLYDIYKQKGSGAATAEVEKYISSVSIIYNQTIRF